MQVVEFKTVYPPNRDPVDMVLVAPQGAAFEKVRTWYRIKSIKPPEGVDLRTSQSDHYQAMLARWSIVEPRYNAWKEGNDLPVDGTPLEAWPGVSREQVAALKGMGIKTVEDVRNMSDSAIAMCRWPNARQLPELAKQYLEGRDIAAAAEEKQELLERLAAMEEMLEARTTPEDTPKRGRPKKEQVQDDKAA